MKLKNTMRLKYIVGLIGIGVFLIVSLVAFANWKIPHDTQPFIYSNVDSIPSQKTALILGAARYLRGRENLYFRYRIQAAKDLYEAGKVQAFVVSGDNGRKEYNEAEDMRNALMEVGVPEHIIYLDYAGFRTLDSVVRMKEIFGQDSFIIVSQQFHNERAIFLAQHYGLTTYGYNAKDLRLNRWSIRTKTRELFARVKVFVDILSGKGPKFLGEPIPIEVENQKH